MPRPPVLEASSLKCVCRVASQTGRSAERDVALLCVAYSTGLTPNEIAKLTIADYLNANGETRIDSEVRAAIAFNRASRPLYWSNGRTQAAVDRYLEVRVSVHFGTCPRSRRYRTLDPGSPLFLTCDGAPFTFTRRRTAKGSDSYSCESLTEVFRRLHVQAGVEGGNASAARRTFAVRLHRNGCNLKMIAVLLGIESLTAVKALVDADPRRLSKVVADLL